MVYNQFSRDELRDLLVANVLQVTFDKLNGDERVMTCTLKRDILPAAVASKVDSDTKKAAETSLSVWDVNANGWRSFRMDKIKSVAHVDLEVEA